MSETAAPADLTPEQAAAMVAYWQSPTDAGSMPIHLLLYAQECVGRLAAEVSRLRAQLDEARDALQAIAQGGLPGQPLSLEQIARHALAQLDQARTERHDSHDLPDEGARMDPLNDALREATLAVLLGSTDVQHQTVDTNGYIWRLLAGLRKSGFTITEGDRP